MGRANRMSVATIDSPEFINITSISPLISKCEIKVLYVGENRNKSYISKEVATKMAQSLPGVPIVGYWSETKEDFLDHGERVIIDGDGVKFKDMTKPYGFVAPNARVWFQKFDDTDEFGNHEIREYLMTEGYLWTKQYEECKRIMSEGNPQSMKLFEEGLKGYWSTDKNKGIDFFIINDALVENLCILGEEVEPCFEGADITSPNVSSKFSKTDEVVTTLFSMMKELKDVLEYGEGGNLMDTEDIKVEDTVEIAAEEVTEEPVVEEVTVEEPVVETAVEESPAVESDFEKKEEDDNKEEDKKEEDNSEENDSDSEDKKKEEEKKFELSEEEYFSLTKEIEDLKAENEVLKAFKLEVEMRKRCFN